MQDSSFTFPDDGDPLSANSFPTNEPSFLVSLSRIFIFAYSVLRIAFVWPLNQAILQNVDLDWSAAQHFLFQVADKLSAPSIHSFQVACLLQWNHYHYLAYYVSLPGIILLLSVLCYMCFLAHDVWRRKLEFNNEKAEVQEKITSERRKGNDISILQQSLHDLKSAPNFLALGRGTDALLSRIDEKWEDKAGNVIFGPTEDQISEMPATAFDIAICFSLIMFHFSWIIIIKHLVQLIRTRTFVDTGAYLLADLSLSVETRLHRALLLGAVFFSGIYLCIFPGLIFWTLRTNNDRLHWQSVKNRLGFLFQGFHHEFYWWDFVAMGRKLSLLVRQLSQRISQKCFG